MQVAIWRETAAPSDHETMVRFYLCLVTHIGLLL